MKHARSRVPACAVMPPCHPRCATRCPRPAAAATRTAGSVLRSGESMTNMVRMAANTPHAARWSMFRSQALEQPNVDAMRRAAHSSPPRPGRAALASPGAAPTITAAMSSVLVATTQMTTMEVRYIGHVTDVTNYGRSRRSAMNDLFTARPHGRLRPNQRHGRPVADRARLPKRKNKFAECVNTPDPWFLLLRSRGSTGTVHRGGAPLCERVKGQICTRSYGCD